MVPSSAMENSPLSSGWRQTVIFSAHLSFAALYLARALARRGLALPIATWATTALTARSAAGDAVRISGIRQRLDVATLPSDRSEHGLAASRALFGDRFEPRADALAIMLSNLNPPSHMANMLGNLTRAEKGDANDTRETIARIAQIRAQ